jgi:hypothetical protein
MVSKIVRDRILDEFWDWLEIGIECEKPNPAIAEMATKINQMRQFEYLYNSDVIEE